jgi:hypothetical protein
MIKYLVLSTNFLVALFLNFIFQTPVQMNIEAPTTVNAGEQFEITVTLNKGDLSSFSRFTQKIPAGLTATPSVSSNADFSFLDQKVRLIWLRLPAEETVSVTYNIHVDPRLKGEFNLEGMFSYIEDNDRKSVKKVSNIINIVPSPNIPPNQLVDINQFEDAVIPDLTPVIQGDVMCVRKTPSVSGDNQGLIVEVIVSKGNQDKFAKIEESVPTGYQVEPLEDQDAIFSYKDGLVKFLWMNLPSAAYFYVSYKLIPVSADLNANIDINGAFSYIQDDNKTVKIDIVQEDFQLAEKSPEAIAQVFEQLTTGVQQEFEAQQTFTKLPANDVGGKQTMVEHINDDKDTPYEGPPSLLTQPKGSAQKETAVSGQTKNGKTPDKKPKQAGEAKKVENKKTNILSPERGVYYRVQIAAGHKPINIRHYFKKFDLEKTVKKERHEGWYKYSVGSFQLYKEARDYRNYIWRTTIIDDAFVAAYNEGNRITVQEALMIADQQWYK